MPRLFVLPPLAGGLLVEEVRWDEVEALEVAGRLELVAKLVLGVTRAVRDVTIRTAGSENT
jgi:hypothetical protein